jgi:protein-S-isoprenylcysteine O-methyltransferase Ste14
MVSCFCYKEVTLRDTINEKSSEHIDIMGEAKSLAIYFLPLFIVSLTMKILFPRAFSFLGKFWGAGMAIGLELCAIGLLFWVSAAAKLIPALKEGRLATSGAYGLCRHPIYAWWVYFLLPAIALCLDSWMFIALSIFVYFLSRNGAMKEETALAMRFGDEYREYTLRVRRLLPIPRFKPFTLHRWGKAILCLICLGVFTLAALIVVVEPIAANLGTSSSERGRAYAGDEIIPHPRQGFIQAVPIRAPAGEVWRWLVQIGYKRAGWYNIDAINRLAGPDYFFEGNGSANRVVPELQNIALGDKIALAPGAELTVTRIETGRLLLLVGDPSGASSTNAAWTFEIVPVGENACRLISKFRSVFPGGLSAGLLNGFVNTIGGAILQQPAMLEGIRLRAERSLKNGL